VRMVIILVIFDIISTGLLWLSSSSPFSLVGGSWGNKIPCSASYTAASSSLLSFLVIAGEEMLIDYLILDNETVNRMLLCNQQWFSHKNTTVIRTPNGGV
jgi:hypothetical protein